MDESAATDVVLRPGTPRRTHTVPRRRMQILTVIGQPLSVLDAALVITRTVHTDRTALLHDHLDTTLGRRGRRTQRHRERRRRIRPLMTITHHRQPMRRVINSQNIRRTSREIQRQLLSKTRPLPADFPFVLSSIWICACPGQYCAGTIIGLDRMPRIAILTLEIPATIDHMPVHRHPRRRRKIPSLPNRARQQQNDRHPHTHLRTITQHRRRHMHRLTRRLRRLRSSSASTTETRGWPTHRRAARAAALTVTVTTGPGLVLLLHAETTSARATAVAVNEEARRRRVDNGELITQPP